MSDYTQQHSISPHIVGYWALLWVLFVMLSQVETIRPVVVALAWLLALAVLMFVLDPANPGNILGMIRKGTIG